MTLAGDATFGVDAGARLAVSGGIVGPGARLNKVGGGVLTLSGVNLYGATDVMEGALYVRNLSAVGSGAITLQNNAVLGALYGGVGEFDSAGMASLLQKAGGSYTLGFDTGNAPGWSVYAADLSVQNLLKSGTGTLALAGAQSYQGVRVQTGTLQFGTLGSGGSPGAATVLVDAGARAVFSLQGGSYSGTISGEGAVVVDGGSLSLAGNNTHTGGTTLAAGTLHLGNAGALGAGTTAALLVTGTSTIRFGNGVAADISAGSLAFGPGAVVTLDTGTNTVALGKGLGNAGNTRLIKTGPGTLVLDAASSHTGGTTLEGGSLVLGHAMAVGTIGSITFNASSTLRYAATWNWR